MRRYRTLLFVVALVVINALGLSLTLVNRGSYRNSLYYRFTRQRFAWILSDPRPAYPIQAGWASVAVSLAGTSTAGTTPDSIRTQALALTNGTTRAVILSVDLPMMPPPVAQALEQKLPKLGFAWKNVYLGATYSQPGLGSWTNDYMAQRQFGPYNQQRVNQLTAAILKAVSLAQSQMATVQLGYTQADQNGQEQRIIDRRQVLHLLQFRKPTGESALVYTAPVRSMPGGETANAPDQTVGLQALTNQLEKQTHSFTLALAGSIDDTGLSSQLTSGNVQALAVRLATLLTRQPLHTDSTLIAQTAPLIQNDPQIRISQNWRLKPWLAKALYGDYPAELKALRIGQTVFVGCPGGVSTELAGNLLTLPIADQRPLVITSYNGGNLGRIVPDSYYYAENSPYMISQTNRFGPHTAQFFEDMTQSLVSSLK
ncbi:hypothetical protein [Spirosoma sp.]|uniref:hypothetical protein n=1 Tax=Spirosoma sp. TaxID=1899569 RepID=UPI0026182C90|nr:hypothetical protein [Spirosoma sp.]MCX6217863.1 hypothetical protein [Spirosoma sp.]